MINLNEIADTGCKVSSFGLGTVKFGRNSDVKYPADFDIPDDAVIQNLLAVARDHNVNLLDTAPAYGASEKRLGSLLKSQRQNWVISTKVGEYYEGGKSRFDFSAKDGKVIVHKIITNEKILRIQSCLRVQVY